jgi:hypothetical protein
LHQLGLFEAEAEVAAAARNIVVPFPGAAKEKFTAQNSDAFPRNFRALFR